MPMFLRSDEDQPDAAPFPVGSRVRLKQSVWTPIRELPAGLLGVIVGSDPANGKLTIELDLTSLGLSIGEVYPPFIIDALAQQLGHAVDLTESVKSTQTDVYPDMLESL